MLGPQLRLAFLAFLCHSSSTRAYLRYNEIQQKNSHNSYERTEGLIDQMIYHHCRTVEIDAHLGFTAGLFDGKYRLVYQYLFVGVMHESFLILLVFKHKNNVTTFVLLHDCIIY